MNVIGIFSIFLALVGLFVSARPIDREAEQAFVRRHGHQGSWDHISLHSSLIPVKSSMARPTFYDKRGLEDQAFVRRHGHQGSWDHISLHSSLIPVKSSMARPTIYDKRGLDKGKGVAVDREPSGSSSPPHAPIFNRQLSPPPRRLERAAPLTTTGLAFLQRFKPSASSTIGKKRTFSEMMVGKV